MTEIRVLGRRGNIKGKAIYFGSAVVTITGSATSGVKTTVFSPTYIADPELIIGLPKWEQTTGGSADYVTGDHWTTDDASLHFAIHAWVNAAQGSYKTVTLTYNYLVIGEPQD